MSEESQPKSRLPELIMGIDPGGTTGVCIARNGVSQNYWEVPAWHGLDKLLEEHHPDLVVCERWSLYPKKAQAMINNEFIPVQVIGVLRYLCGKYEIPLVIQPANVTKAVKLGRACAVHGDHARSAYKHILAYRARSKC